ncbi:MAG TPA: CHASE3 domain-containing protein, partial [Saprospiraceae bacterium]|nr:CHASE3 domain-containing protein [Saprospiraceae bacterium]
MGLIGTFNSSRILTGIFIISLLVLVFFANVSFRQISSINESEQLVLHSFKENLELQQLLSFLKDAETGQRGYFITHDSIFLQPYIGARDKVNKSFITLRSLTKDNIVQQRNLDTLFNLINTRFAWMVIALKDKTELNNSESFKMQLLEGKKAMDDIRFHINKMINIENGILQH